MTSPSSTRRISLRLLALLCVLALGTAACGDDTGTDTTDDTVETTAVDDTTTSTTSVAPPETTVPTTEAITIDPADPQLLGYTLGTEAEPVIEALTSALGEPTNDSGVAETECPPFNASRTVAWGNLIAEFDASTGSEVLAGWIYDVAVDRPGGPTPDQIVLPAGLTWSSTYNEVFNAFADPVPTVSDTSLGTLVVVGPVTFGFPIGAADDAPLERAWVGAITTCS